MRQVPQKERHFLRRKGRYGVLLIPLLLAFQQLSAQPVIQTVTFSSGSLHVDQVNAEDAHTYSRVSYDELSNTGDPGSPSLPVKYVHLIVPRDKNFSDISIQADPPQTSSLPTLVFPAQYPIPTGDNPAPPFTGPDPQVYGSSETYPSKNLVKYVGEGYYDGNKHIITVAVYPVQYIPAEGTLSFYPSITFTVSENTGIPLAMHAIDKAPIAGQQLYDDALPGMVSNPDYIGKFVTQGGEGHRPTGGHVPFYEYVIITSKDLVPAFEELAGWKRRKGLNAGVVNIQDILSDPAYAGGDDVSNINDDAGKLRAYLADAYENGHTVYAVLGGDISIIPVRYAAGVNNAFSYPSGNGSVNAHIPSDLYYTDFNGNWNADGDGFYGEYQDQVDYQPEIFVGRMLVSTIKQAYNHIYKVIRYERNPGRGDRDYLTRAFMTQADEPLCGIYTAAGPIDSHQANAVASHFTNFPPGNIKIWNESPSCDDPNPTGPYTPDVIAEINKHYGLVSFFGHGGPWAIKIWSAGQNGHPDGNIHSFDADHGNNEVPLPGNGLDNLDDFNHITDPYQNYPHVFYTIACETVPYDNEIGFENGYRHFGDTYTNNSIAGCVAYLGGTRVGFVMDSYKLFKLFADKLLQGSYQIGRAEGLSKAAFDDNPWCNKAHSLIGCPETDMWTGQPSYFKAHISGVGTVTVNTGIIEPATICVTSALDNGATYRQVIIGSNVTFYNVPSPYAVCITRHNYIPYLWPQTMGTGNHDFQGTAYVGGLDVTTQSGSQPAPTTVENGSNVFFHAENSIILGQGFTVEPGAAFEAK